MAPIGPPNYIFCSGSQQIFFYFYNPKLVFFWKLIPEKFFRQIDEDGIKNSCFCTGNIKLLLFETRINSFFFFYIYYGRNGKSTPYIAHTPLCPSSREPIQWPNEHRRAEEDPGPHGGAVQARGPDLGTDG